MNKKIKILREIEKYLLTPIEEHGGFTPSVEMAIKKTIDLTIKEFTLGGETK